MGISKKTLLIVASILGAIIIALFFYLQFFVLEKYIDLEKIEMTNNIIQSLKVLNQHTKSLDKATTAFSISNDTYNFLNDNYNKDYGYDLNDIILKDLGINLFLLIDNDKNIQFEKIIDPGKQNFFETADTLKNKITKQRYIDRTYTNKNGFSGIVVVDSYPYIVVSKPVLPARDSLKENAAGIIIIAQMLGSENLDYFLKMQKNTINIYHLGDEETRNRFNDVITSLEGGNIYETQYPSGEEIAGYALIKDIDSEPALLLEVISPRDIYSEGKNNVYTFFIVLVLTGIISCLVIFFLIEKLFLSRIVDLSKESEEIGQSNDLTKKIKYSGKDEISRLAVSINRMLRNLRHNQLDILRSEKRFKDLVELLPEIVIETDTNQKITFANKSFFKIFGYKEKDIENNLYIKDILKPGYIDKFIEKTHTLSKGEKTESEEYEAVKKDGSTFPILLSSIATFNEYGVINGFRSIAVDITNRKREEEQLRELEERWEFALEGSGDGVWDWDFANNKVFYSRRLKELLGFDETELKNDFNEVMDRIHPEDIDRVKRSIDEHLKGQTKYYTAEYRIMRNDRTYMWAQDRGKVIRWDKNGKPLRMIGTFTDITVRKQLEDEIKRLAYRDPLTGLPNRLLFNDRIETTIEASKRYNKKFALIIIDVDKFKKINDTYGHVMGDKLILNVGEKISGILRRSDTIARFGGDEFLLLLPDIKSKRDVDKIARKIFNSFQKNIKVDGKKLSTTLSMGISIYPDDGKSSSRLLKNADTALYEVKDSGRNNYRFYHYNNKN